MIIVGVMGKSHAVICRIPYEGARVDSGGGESPSNPSGSFISGIVEPWHPGII